MQHPPRLATRLLRLDLLKHVPYGQLEGAAEGVVCVPAAAAMDGRGRCLAWPDAEAEGVAQLRLEAARGHCSRHSGTSTNKHAGNCQQNATSARTDGGRHAPVTVGACTELPTTTGESNDAPPAASGWADAATISITNCAPP